MQCVLAIKLFAMFAMLAMVCAPVEAQKPVDLELVLAVDVSGSVSDDRFVLQQRGYVAAFRDSRLLQAPFGPGLAAE